MKVIINKEKKYFWKGDNLNTEDGIFKKEDIEKARPGEKVKTHLGKEFFVIEPNILDYFEILKRGPQTILPKDAIYITSVIEEGNTVVEGGTGSGWLTIFLARAVGEAGKVISYEIRKNFLEIARKNLETVGLLNRVVLKNGDIFRGFEECDHLVADLPDAWRLLKFKDRIKPGGYIIFYFPQMTQVIKTYEETKKYEDIRFEKVVEIIEREWIVREKILRPKQWLDHTAFLVFLRRI